MHPFSGGPNGLAYTTRERITSPENGMVSTDVMADGVPTGT